MVERLFSRREWLPSKVAPEHFWDALARCEAAVLAQWADLVEPALIKVKDSGGEYGASDLAEAQTEATGSRHTLSEVSLFFREPWGDRKGRSAYISAEIADGSFYARLEGPNEAEIVGLVAVLTGEVEAAGAGAPPPTAQRLVPAAPAPQSQPVLVPTPSPVSPSNAGNATASAPGAPPVSSLTPPAHVRWFRREGVRDGLIVAALLAVVTLLATLTLYLTT